MPVREDARRGSVRLGDGVIDLPPDRIRVGARPRLQRLVSETVKALAGGLHLDGAHQLGHANRFQLPDGPF